MNERKQKNGKRISNPTSLLARELMARTLEKAAELDNDPGAVKLAQKVRKIKER